MPALFLVPLAAVLAFDSDVNARWGDWVPRNPGWQALMDYREQQVHRIKNTQEKWDAILNVAVSGILTPAFTKKGWAVVKQPPGVHKRLNDTLHAGFAKSAAGKGKQEDHDHKDARTANGVFQTNTNEAEFISREHKVDQISGDKLPGFVPLGRLTTELLKEMQPMHEAWIGGVPLVPSNAYGLRVYERGNSLTMHTDHVGTHVVSSIVHVDRDTDEPWPIVIEGLDGVTMEVDLQPGEMLFYESAKCVHGRPRPLNGNWYSSLFVHYRPADWTIDTSDAIKLVEPIFHESISKAGSSRLREHPQGKQYADLRMRGTGFREPGCTNEWCNLASDWPPSDGSPISSNAEAVAVAVSVKGNPKADIDGQNGDL